MQVTSRAAGVVVVLVVEVAVVVLVVRAKEGDHRVGRKRKTVIIMEAVVGAGRVTTRLDRRRLVTQ